LLVVLALAGGELIKVLRLRKLQVNGRAMEEAVKLIDGTGVREYTFVLEERGEIEDVRHPVFILNVHNTSKKINDQRQQTPFKTDEEALAFWDALVAGVRWRPDHGPQTTIDNPPDPQYKTVNHLAHLRKREIRPGDLCRTGQICPITGVWAVKEENGYRSLEAPQVFTQGRPFPTARVYLPGGVKVGWFKKQYEFVQDVYWRFEASFAKKP